MKVWLGLVLALGCAAVVAACAGHEWASPFDLARALAGDDSLRSRLLVEWRIPRVFAAAFVGVLLGLGGAVFQGVFRNPLAEPYLLGSAGGAALGATVALLVPLGLPQSLLLPVLAFAGAWGATVLVIGVSRVAGAVDAAGMLLAGVAVAAVLGALRSFMDEPLIHDFSRILRSIAPSILPPLITHTTFFPASRSRSFTAAISGAAPAPSARL